MKKSDHDEGRNVKNPNWLHAGEIAACTLKGERVATGPVNSPHTRLRSVDWNYGAKFSGIGTVAARGVNFGTPPPRATVHREPAARRSANAFGRKPADNLLF